MLFVDHSRVGFALAAAALAAAAAGGCAEDLGHPPVARIEAAPRAIPEHDELRTDVILDGTGSADSLDDPDGSEPLGYRWEIVGDEFRFESGDAADPMPVVRLRGITPASVYLTVTDADGLENTARLQLQLTIPE